MEEIFKEVAVLMWKLFIKHGTGEASFTGRNEFTAEIVGFDPHIEDVEVVVTHVGDNSKKDYSFHVQQGHATLLK